MNFKKTKNLSEKSTKNNVLINSIIGLLFVILLLLTTIFILNYIDIDKLTNKNDNSIGHSLVISDDEPPIENEKEPLKRLTEADFKYCETITSEQRLTFLNMHNYAMEDRLKVYLSDEINDVGLIYYDTNSNEKISINADKEFIAASTYKLSLALYSNYLASIGELNLDESIEFLPEDYVDGTGILYYLDTIGPYTIQELLDLSLIYSDNIATDMLSRHLGGKAFV